MARPNRDDPKYSGSGGQKLFEDDDYTWQMAEEKRKKELGQGANQGPIAKEDPNWVGGQRRGGSDGAVAPPKDTKINTGSMAEAAAEAKRKRAAAAARLPNAGAQKKAIGAQ